MSWFRKSPRGGAPDDIVERLTTTRRFPPRVEQETASLGDEEIVRGWVRALRPERDQQVHVRRTWGVVAAVCDGKWPIGVFFTNGERSWVAEPPGGGPSDLTPEQVEHVVVDALTSTQRPTWPEWRPLV